MRIIYYFARSVDEQYHLISSINFAMHKLNQMQAQQKQLEVF